MWQLQVVSSWKDCNNFAVRYYLNEAEDLGHQAFVNGYDKILGERNESEQHFYLYSTVKNVCLNFVRDSRPVYTDVMFEPMMTWVSIDFHDYMY